MDCYRVMANFNTLFCLTTFFSFHIPGLLTGLTRKTATDLQIKFSKSLPELRQDQELLKRLPRNWTLALSISYQLLYFFPLLLSLFSFLSAMELQPDHKELLALARAKMPFGKYEGRFLSELPEYYLVWYRQKGFPKGRLGNQMAQIYELKLNGMEQLLRSIRSRYPER